MHDSPDPDLIKITEIFLVPSRFLVAALGTADTNPHRAIVSILGLIVSLLWWICSREALADLTPAEARGNHRVRTRALSWLAIVFVAGWLLLTVVHLWLWNRPMGDWSRHQVEVLRHTAVAQFRSPEMRCWSKVF